MNNYKAWELDEENNLTMTALLLLFTSNEGLGSSKIYRLKEELRKSGNLNFVYFWGDYLKNREGTHF